MIYKNVYKKFAICQGLLNKAKQMNIADDFCHHQLTDMMIQETHMPGFEIHEIESSSGEILYLYFTGHKDKSVAWTGIFVRPSSKVNFTPVSERTYMIKVKSYLRDSMELIHILERMKVPAQALLVTLDIQNLYTNISHKEAILSFLRVFKIHSWKMFFSKSNQICVE